MELIPLAQERYKRYTQQPMFFFFGAILPKKSQNPAHAIETSKSTSAKLARTVPRSR
jgi:hypothetical protein